MDNRKLSLEERLNAHPELKQRIEKLLGIVEDASDDIQSVDDVEESIINELQRFGQELIHGWAMGKESLKTEEYRRTPVAARHGKKK